MELELERAGGIDGRGSRSGDRRRSPRSGGFFAATAVWLLLAALLAGGSPSRAHAQDDGPTATVRVVHGAADAGAVDLYVDGALAVAGIAFPSVSDPISLPAGEHELRLVGSGISPDQALVTADVVLDAGRLYEVAALGTVADLQVNLYEVDLAPLTAGRARLRFIHGVPDAGPLTLAIGNAEDGVLPPVEFPNESEVVELEGGTFDLQIRTEDGTAALTLNGANLEAGVVYDFYAVGQLGEDALQVLAVVSQPEQAPAADARPAALYAGACADDTSGLGEVVSPLNGPAAPGGDPAGQAGAASAASSVTSVGLPFEDVLAADHAIAVLAAEDDPSVLACGEVGGILTENGALVVGLREANGSGAAGVAILAPSALDAAATDISIFVADDLIGAATASAEADDEVSPASLSERADAPTPTPTAAATPATDPTPPVAIEGVPDATPDGIADEAGGPAPAPTDAATPEP